MLRHLPRFETFSFDLFLQRNIVHLIKRGKGFIAGLKSRRFRAEDYPALRVAAWTLWGISGALVLYAFGDFFRGVSDPRRLGIETLFAAGDKFPSEKSSGPEIRNDSLDLKALAGRNPFRPLAGTEPSKPPVLVLPPAPPPPPKVPIKDRAARLRLTGILSVDPVQAVLEDASEQRTLYLSEGESIHGLLVEKILPGKIILKFEDERLELLL